MLVNQNFPKQRLLTVTFMKSKLTSVIHWPYHTYLSSVVKLGQNSYFLLIFTLKISVTLTFNTITSNSIMYLSRSTSIPSFVNISQGIIQKLIGNHLVYGLKDRPTDRHQENNLPTLLRRGHNNDVLEHLYDVQSHNRFVHDNMYNANLQL